MMAGDDELPLEQQQEGEPGAEPGPLPSVDPAGPRKQRLTKAMEQRQADDFWRGLLSTPIGRREIWRDLAQCHAFETIFACGPNGFPQPESTWFNAGIQSVGLRRYQFLLALDPIGIRQMHLEHDPNFHRFVEKDGH